MFVRTGIAAGSMLLACACGAGPAIDRGSFGPFERSLSTTRHGYSVDRDPTGTAPTRHVEVFEVVPGDCGEAGWWSDCATDRERSELSETNKDNRAGSEHWYGWSIYFPVDYRNVYPTKTALGQFHQDGSDVAWMFQNASGGYHLDDQVRGFSRRYYTLIDESELRGRWHTIELHVRWDTGEDGFFRVWVDGEKKVDHAGQTMQAGRVYFKYGVYRTFLSRYANANDVDDVPAQSAYFANVRRGDTRADLLSPQAR